MAAVNSASGGGGSGGSAKGVRAGAAYVELFLEDNAFKRSVEAWRKRLSSASWGLAKAGVGVSGLGSSITGPILAAFKTTFDSINTLSSLSDKLDTPIEGLSALANAAGKAGVSVEDLEGHFENLQERIAQAGKGEGSKDTLNALGMLGINPAALAQMDRVEQFAQIVERLQKVGNRTNALGMASALGGDKFQQVLNIKDVRGGMAEAKREGWIFTTEQKQQAKEISEAWYRIKSAVMQVLVSIGSAILGLSPEIKEYGAIFTNVANNAAKWVKENQELVRTILYIGAGISVVGIGLLTLAGIAKISAIALGGVAFAFTAVSTSIGVVSGIVGFLLTPVGLLIFAVVALGIAFLTMSDHGKNLTSDLGKMFVDLGKIFGDTWKTIKDFVAAGELELAFTAASVGVQAIWYTMLDNLQKSFTRFLKSIRTESSRLLRIGLDAATFGLWRPIFDMAIAGSEGNDWAARKAEEARNQLASLKNSAAVLRAAKEPIMKGAQTSGGGLPSYGPSVKAIGAFQSRDFSRIFDTGSLAQRQVNELQKANVKLQDILVAVGQVEQAIDNSVPRFN